MPSTTKFGIAMQCYLATRTPEELQALLEVIYGFQAPSLQSSVPIMLSSSSPQKKSANRVAKRNSPTRTRVRAAVADTVAATRPLNSWMAFRSFYSPLFPAMQQKDISPIMTQLWQADPFHAKWTIVAKSYSTIRDSVGKEHAPLDDFLNLVCPHIGIINPDNYLAMLGWEVVNDDGRKAVERRFVPDFSSFNDDLKMTNLSSQDIVCFANIAGYVDNVPDTSIFGPTSALTMASRAVQPAASMMTETTVVGAPSQSVELQTFSVDNSDYDTSAFSAVQNDINFGMNQPGFQSFDFDTMPGPVGAPHDMDTFMPNMAYGGPSENSFFSQPAFDDGFFSQTASDNQFFSEMQSNDQSSSEIPSGDMFFSQPAADADKNAAGDAEEEEGEDFSLPDFKAPFEVQMMDEQCYMLRNSGSEWPYYEHFDPNQPKHLQLCWGPGTGDKFDAYNISEWRTRYDI